MITYLFPGDIPRENVLNLIYSYATGESFSEVNFRNSFHEACS